ncbi:TVP38/TMEM64 family protein [Phototrophicus methaneseepsis]|uniref:TVP38/TMEM64 family membrane protein n=1 Tax=Phototrophicus methaneseepsis TaxID=2710758 RepID=A0A7S8IEI9_9CHLR|nr:TVP38/TMEM64 family protein [Phototrophicus methaneseepsis]QPC81868.1 TVP38/TMEM64 family protein [Phototrophicus methaneseepsis]
MPDSTQQTPKRQYSAKSYSEPHPTPQIPTEAPGEERYTQNPIREQISVADKQIEEKRPIRELIVGGLAFAVFLGVVTVGINAIGLGRIQQFIEDAGPMAPVAYIGLKAATYVFAPLTSGPIQVVAGAIFGNVWLGVLYTLIGEVLGGSISFWIARAFGRPVVQRMVGKSGMTQVEEFYKTRMGGWRSLAVARLILFSVWDFLSYAAGLAPVRFISYLLVSIIVGFFPTLIFVGLGTTAIQDGSSLILIYGLVAVLIILPIMFRKPLERLLAAGNAPKSK